jgi:hypothetical protein
MRKIKIIFSTILLILSLAACGTNINNIEAVNQRDFYVYEEFNLENLKIQINKKDALNTDPTADIDARVVEVKIRLNPQDSQRVKALTRLNVKVSIDLSK